MSSQEARLRPANGTAYVRRHPLSGHRTPHRKPREWPICDIGGQFCGRLSSRCGRLNIILMKRKPVRRRDFIAFVGVAFAWPVRARAHQPDRVRRIGVLLPYTEHDPEAKSHLSAITQELQRLGWSQDRNIRIDARFAAGIADQYPLLAKELAA